MSTIVVLPHPVWPTNPLFENAGIIRFIFLIKKGCGFDSQPFLLVYGWLVQIKEFNF